MAIVPCFGSIRYRYVNKDWVKESGDCAGDCIDGECTPLHPREILGNRELEEFHPDILEVLGNPKEGDVVTTTCICVDRAGAADETGVK